MMTYADMIDLVIAQSDIESRAKGIPPIKLTRKLVLRWIHQAEKEIQRRYTPAKASAKVGLTNGVGTLPSDFASAIEVEGGDLSSTTWGSVGDSSYSYAILDDEIKISDSLSDTYGEISVYYTKKIAEPSESDEMQLPEEYEQVVMHKALSNLFKEYYGIAEQEIREIGYVNDAMSSKVIGGIGL